MLNNHPNQEHDNAKIHPPNPESLEQLVERIIHSCAKTVRMGVRTSCIFIS